MGNSFCQFHFYKSLSLCAFRENKTGNGQLSWERIINSEFELFTMQLFIGLSQETVSSNVANTHNHRYSSRLAVFY